mmetsp:Transcript_35511/g.92859  ORF Transcript_35511/g.92859 Transcript_35511/m.92859 type:complete len:608 (+) Transcript_35511:59-1882(+)
MSFDIRGGDDVAGGAEAGTEGAAEAGAADGLAVAELAAALPGAAATTDEDDELTVADRVAHWAEEEKKIVTKIHEAEDDEKAELEAKHEKIKAEIADLEAQSEAESKAPVVAQAAAAPAPAAPEEKSVDAVVGAEFGKFREKWKTVGYSEEELAAFAEKIRSIEWVELQAKLAKTPGCKSIHPSIIDYLQAKWKKTFQIQSLMIPELLANKPHIHNVVFQQRAGTGKTVAFVLNCITRCDPNFHGVQAIILSPTVILNDQTADIVKELTQGSGISVAAQIDRRSKKYALKAPIRAQILCSSPHPLKTWLRKGGRGKSYIPEPERIRVLTLDEADEMLDNTEDSPNSMCNACIDVRNLLLAHNPRIQLVLLSATFSETMREQANNFLQASKNPMKQQYKPAEETVGKNVVEFAVKCRGEADKLKVIEDILSGERGVAVTMAVIFCATRKTVKTLCKTLQASGIDADNVAAVHSEMEQAERINIVKMCKEGKKNFLVCTDILAKGIDIDRCNVVINYDLPTRFNGFSQRDRNSEPDFEKHLHRVGRAGRAATAGLAFHLVNMEEPWWVSHLKRTMKHWNDKALTWLDQEGDWDDVADTAEEENPNIVGQ